MTYVQNSPHSVGFWNYVFNPAKSWVLRIFDVFSDRSLITIQGQIKKEKGSAKDRLKEVQYI